MDPLPKPYRSADPLPIISLSSMIIGSTDTLRGQEIDRDLPNGWSEQPPLLQGPRAQPETITLLKGMIREGIPHVLRCAVWLSNIIQAIHPHQESPYWHEYRTLAKVQALDNAYELLLRTIALSRQDDDDDNNNNNQNSKSSNDPTIAHGKQSNIFVNDIWQSMGEPSYGRDWSSNKSSANEQAKPTTTATTTATSSQRLLTLIPGTTAAGTMSYRRVLIALEQVLGMDYVPLIPTLVALLLTAMSESYAFCAVREMAHQLSNWYFPTTRAEEAAWCLAFGDILRKLHPQTAEYLADRCVLDVDNLKGPLFQNMFLGILPVKYVLRLLDIYTLEGSKVIFRFGVALFVMFKKEASDQVLTISTAAEWWKYMAEWTHNRQHFHWALVVRKAYGLHGRGQGAGLRRQMRFPRRHILNRIIRLEEERWAAEQDFSNEYEDAAPVRPLGLAAIEEKSDDEFVRPVFGQQLSIRQNLAQWMPLSLRLTSLKLIYSTNYHGRSLEMFYNRVQYARHSILLCEVLLPVVDRSNTNGQPHALGMSTIIGMYASQVWRPSNKVYGDGGCMLFRLEPMAVCWKWMPHHFHQQQQQMIHNNSNRRTGTSSTTSNLIMDVVDLDDDESNSQRNQIALLEQFMVATHTYISMGGNPDGSCGLRFNEDLTKGESSPAVGFDNEPLHGLNRGSVFDVGLVEVYGLVRQMDGKSV